MSRAAASRVTGRSAGGRLTLWQICDVTRERTREIEAVSGLESTLAFYDGLPQGLFAVAPDGRIAHLNTTLAQWLRLRPSLARTLTLLDIVSADGARSIRAAARAPARARRGSSSICCARMAARSPRSSSAAARGARHRLRARARPHERVQPARSARPRRGAAQALFQSAPFGIATVDADGRIITANAAFMRMFFVEGRGVPANVADLVPDAEEQAGRELGKALERAVSGRTGAAPIEIFFGPQRELARRIYVSPLGTGARGARRRHPVCHRCDRAEGARS